MTLVVNNCWSRWCAKFWQVTLEILNKMWKKFYWTCWNAEVRGHFAVIDWCKDYLSCQRGFFVVQRTQRFDGKRNRKCLYCPHENSESLSLKRVSWWEMTWKLRKFPWNVLLQFYSQYQVYPWENSHASIKLKERSQSAKVGQCARQGIQGAFSQSITPSSVFAGET